MTVRQLVQHLQDTAPGDAEVLIRVAGEHAAIRRAHVEVPPDRLQPAVIVYTEPT